MAQPLRELLKSLNSPTNLADILIRVHIAKIAAHILKGKMKNPTNSQSAIISAFPLLLQDSTFSKYINIYKKSSYYAADNKPYAFANLISKHF